MGAEGVDPCSEIYHRLAAQPAARLDALLRPADTEGEVPASQQTEVGRALSEEPFSKSTKTSKEGHRVEAPERALAELRKATSGQI